MEEWLGDNQGFAHSDSRGYADDETVSSNQGFAHSEPRGLNCAGDDESVNARMDQAAAQYGPVENQGFATRDSRGKRSTGYDKPTRASVAFEVDDPTRHFNQGTAHRGPRGSIADKDHNINQGRTQRAARGEYDVNEQSGQRKLGRSGQPDPEPDPFSQAYTDSDLEVSDPPCSVNQGVGLRLSRGRSEQVNKNAACCEEGDDHDEQDTGSGTVPRCSMGPRARREQCTTLRGMKPRDAMTKRLRAGLDGSEAGCRGNRSRERSNRDGWTGGLGPSRYNLKIYRPNLRRRRKGGVVKEGRRCVMTRIARRLETIHPNPGPNRRGRRGNRSRERRLAYRRTKKYRKRVRMKLKKAEQNRLEEEARLKKVREQEERRPPKIVTWNVQKTAMRENNRRRLRGIATYCVKNRWEVVMMTEITSQEEGFFWMGEAEEKVVVIHGKKAAIMLTGKWANDWIEQGSQRWLGNRMAAVKVNHFRLVCGYQPLWNYGETEREQYRAEMESQVRATRAGEWLIIGGDHNAVVGKPGDDEAGDPQVVGRYGMGRRNEAGRDLLRWCGEQGLAWVNSFYLHNWRGTWCHPARNLWFEIDGFIMKKWQMGQLVKKVNTIIEDGFSDHRPKVLTLRNRDTGQPTIVKRKQKIRLKINWEALQTVEKKTEYKMKTEERMANEEDTGTVKWERIATVMTEVAMDVCGKKKKDLLTPWVAGREAQLAVLRNGITDAIQDVRRCKANHDAWKTAETEQNLKDAISSRKMTRRVHKLALRAWEREYWENIEQMRDAQERGNYGEMYRILRRLGMRGTATAAPSSCFTSEEFKEHFSKVSQHEYEKDAETWRTTINAVEDRKNVQQNQDAGKKMAETPSVQEVWKAIKEMRDKAPGEDEVRISYVKEAAETVQRYVIKTVQRMFETEPRHWEEMVGKGLVIPLFKKGDRKDRNNYRGVCLLSMGSRILARVLATRIRKWSEEMKLVDDNQQGFRSGRSTMDATQIMVRIQEESLEKEKDKAAAGVNTMDAADDGGAVLLDITKAYPRVNRPAMWSILERAGMQQKCLRTVRGIHEKTTYKVKGKEDCSTEWRANRGLREGCATSPALFNIYHAEVMRQAKKKRQEECERQGAEAGIEWMYIPGSALPPISASKAMKSSDAQTIRVTETLFADDTTLIGERSELAQNVNVVKETMGSFEEKCHDGKEEWMYFGKPGSENIRMLGSWMGREKDVKERLSRGNKSWWILKKRMRRTTIRKKTQARVIEACVESTMLFDCASRPWMVSEVKRIQQLIDRCYRYVWMDKKGGPGLMQMEAKSVNMFDVRKEHGVDSVETKISRRVLERIGHVTRMDDERMTKKVVFGWLKKDDSIPRRKSKKNTTITFWRKQLKQAGVDPDTMEIKATDRARWKKICQEDTVRRQKRDLGRAKNAVQGTAQVGPGGSDSDRDDYICEWPDCGKRFETKTGMVHHQRIKHRRQEARFECSICQQKFKQKSNLTNHMKSCRGATRAGECPFCSKNLSRSNMARHVKGCRRNPERHRAEVPRQEDEEGPGGMPEASESGTEGLANEGEENDGDAVSREGASGTGSEASTEDRGAEPDAEPEEPQQSTRRATGRTQRTPKWPCCQCGKEVRGGVMCTTSGKWCHFKCGRTTYRVARGWSVEEVQTWECPGH